MNKKIPLILAVFLLVFFLLCYFISSRRVTRFEIVTKRPLPSDYFHTNVTYEKGEFFLFKYIPGNKYVSFYILKFKNNLTTEKFLKERRELERRERKKLIELGKKVFKYNETMGEKNGWNLIYFSTPKSHNLVEWKGNYCIIILSPTKNLLEKTSQWIQNNLESIV